MAASDSLDAVIQEYVEAASAHGQATAAGDSTTANHAHDVLAAIYRRLREDGTQRQLLHLLNHRDPAVVAWVGAHALEFAPAESERVLTDLARRDSSIIGFTAQMTLSEWRDGKLSFP
jgi:hypothetical protein